MERDSLKIIEIISKNINTYNLAKIDYVEVVDYLSLQRVNYIEKSV